MHQAAEGGDFQPVIEHPHECACGDSVIAVYQRIEDPFTDNGGRVIIMVCPEDLSHLHAVFVIHVKQLGSVLNLVKQRP